MVRSCDNSTPIAIRILAFFLSLGVFITTIWLNLQVIPHCDPIGRPLIYMSASIVALSVVGIIAAFFGEQWILCCYGCPLVLLLILMLILSIFVFAVTITSDGGKGYTVGNHDKSWLKKRANNNWNKISSCLVKNKICDNDHFHLNNTSHIRSGCCNPSDDCGFNTTSHPSSTNPDCTKWSSDEKVLCYSCEACKIGWMNITGPNWMWIAVANIIFLVLIGFLNMYIFWTTNCCIPTKLNKSSS